MTKNAIFAPNTFFIFLFQIHEYKTSSQSQHFFQPIRGRSSNIQMAEASLVVSYLCGMPWNWLELPALGTETCGRMCQQLKTAWMMTLNFYFQNKLSELSLTHPVPFTPEVFPCTDARIWLAWYLILSSLCCVRWSCWFPLLDWLREVARTVMDMVER